MPSSAQKSKFVGNSFKKLADEKKQNQQLNRKNSQQTSYMSIQGSMAKLQASAQL